MKSKNIIIYLLMVFLLASCYDQEIQPVAEEDFPLQIVLDAIEGGTYESDDSYGLKVAFDEGIEEVTDEDGNVIAGSPGGTRGPADTDLTINFVIEDVEGLNLGSEVSIDEIIYEIDDCTEGSASFTFNQDGTGSFTMPQGVEEIEIVFALDDASIDNDIENTEDKGFKFRLTGIDGSPENVLLNINNEFEYAVLDDEAIYNEWVLDHTNSDLLNKFLTALAPVNEDLEALEAADIDEIIFEYGFEEVKIVVVLTETEMVTECGETEEENLELEIEGEFSAEDDEIEMTLENEDGDEFIYTGTYTIDLQDPLTFTLTFAGVDEDDNNVAEEVTLTLEDN